MKFEKFESFDKTVLQTYVWDEVEEPKGVVQIVHGMAEHGRRYDHFAQFMNKNGYIVIADDHRAHGETETDEERGHHEGDIFGDTVKDEIEITKYLTEKYKLPVVYLGHSYGSFMGQRYIQLNSQNIAGCLLSGTARMNGLLSNVGVVLSKICCAFAGEKSMGKFMDKASFGAFNVKFKKDDPKFGWLSRDKEQVRKYVEDPQCGHLMSNNFFRSLTTNMAKVVYKKSNLEQIRKDLPIAIFCGKCDPVNGGKGKDAEKLFGLYKKIGLKNVSFRLFDNARHEIMNETNNDEVYNEFLKAINGFLK